MIILILTPLEQEIAHFDVDKKVPQTIRARIYTHPHAHMEATHFKRGLP